MWAGTFASTLEIVNNTVAYNMWETTYSERNWAVVVGYPEEMTSPPVNLTMVNNIFAFNATPMEDGATGVYLGPGVTLAREGYNLYYSRADAEITAEFMTGRDTDITRDEIANGTWMSIIGQPQTNLTADPHLVAAWPDVDLHLQASSPAVDAGSADGAPDDDVDGNVRDDQPDLGANEE